MATIKETVRQMGENKDKHVNVWTYFGYFLDDFYITTRTESERYDLVQEEPDKYKAFSKEEYAFIAASVHKLCSDYGVRVPRWVMKKEYFLEEPYFSLNAVGDWRLLLISESPTEFRMRHIYTLANSLKR